MTPTTLHRAAALGCLLAILLPASASSQAADDCLDQADADGRPIRAFIVKARWNSLADVQWPVPVGSPYTSEAASAAMNAVRNRLVSQSGTEVQTRGYIGFRFIEPCPRPADGGGVEVEIKVIEARLPLGQPISGQLPVPRSNLPSSVAGTPQILTLLNPVIGLTNDTAVGVAQSIAFTTDLLSVDNILGGQPPASPSWSMPLSVAGRRGLNEDTYDGLVSLAISHEAPVEVVQRFDVHAEYLTSKAPQGTATLLQDGWRAGARLRLRPRQSALRQITLVPDLAISTRRRTEAATETTDETAFTLFAVADASVPLGPLRWATRVDAARVRDRESYQRFSTLVGWNAQIPLSRTHTNRTLGLELNAGAGQIWGDAPEHARFFGGNTGVDLLSEPPDSPALPLALTIPNLRSFGQSQAQTAVGGARSYWSLNANVAIPIPRLLMALIPRDEVAAGIPLNEMVYRNGTNSALNFLQSYYENVEGRAPEDAERTAKAEIARIEPALRFITRRANLYALKPLIMFDVVRLSSATDLPGRTFQAAGAGLQLTLVVARVEGGYMWTLDRQPGDSRGNFVFRMIFDNIF